MQKVPQENNLNSRNALPSGYELLWYQIKSVLGQGAFGITYLAQDINLDRLVAIKEFLPGQYAMRDGEDTVQPISEALQEKFTLGLQRFIDEARILDQFEHPNIIRIMNIFEANNTAYMVMGYEQGVSLKEILIRQDFLDEFDLLNILFPILNGLEQVHAAGFIHRDIKPANIFIRTDGSPALLDFGSARQSLDTETHTLTSLVSPGYAPIEQYVSKSNKQGPWSDIYGMAATLYRAVTGVPPSDAITRGEALTGNDEDNLISCADLADKRYSKDFIAAIDHGLSFLTRDRPQTIDEWRQEFLSSPALIAVNAENKNGSSSRKKISGYASGQVVSLVKESLTQTVTRLHDDPDFTQRWNSDDSISVELAHKKGFQRGLKFALILLTLIAGGLFIGNFQKIQQVVKPGYVPQDVISDKAVEINDQGKLVVEEIVPEVIQREKVEPEEIIEEKVVEKIIDETSNIGTVGAVSVEAEMEAEIFIDENQVTESGIVIEEIEIIPESSPLVLDEQTAAALEAEGKIIIVDEVDQPSVKEQQAAPIKKVIEKKQISDRAVVSNDDEKTSSGNLDQKEVDQKESKKMNTVVIEEVYVPPKKQEEEITDRIKDFVDFLVENGEEATGKGEGVREQLGGQDSEKINE